MKIKDNAIGGKKRPWMNHLYGARQRCENPKHHAYKYYGGKGIQCWLTPDDIMSLWHRDKAHLLTSPSIDRKDDNGNYVYDNCQFIERKENALKGLSKSWVWDEERLQKHSEQMTEYFKNHPSHNCVGVLVFDKKDNFVGSFNSQSEAARKLEVPQSSISEHLSGQRGYVGGYKFMGLSTDLPDVNECVEVDMVRIKNSIAMAIVYSTVSPEQQGMIMREVSRRFEAMTKTGVLKWKGQK